MPQPTLTELITDAYYEATIYAPGELVDPRHINFAAGRLNSMLDAWKAERLTIYRFQRTGPFALVSGQESYTIGVGAQWDTPRPIWIDHAGLLQTIQSQSPIPEYAMEVYTDAKWWNTITKGLQSTLPTALWYDRTYNASGYGTIYPWPIPTVANYVVLYSPVPVNEFTLPDDLTNVINFPPAYRDFLMYWLTVRIAPTFGVTLSESTVGLANLAMERVKNSNLHLNELRVDDALIRRDSGTYNWRNDSFQR